MSSYWRAPQPQEGKAIFWLSPRILAASTRLQKCLLDGRIVVNSNIFSRHFYPSLLLQLFTVPTQPDSRHSEVCSVGGCVTDCRVFNHNMTGSGIALIPRCHPAVAAPDRGGVLAVLHPLWLFHISYRAGCRLWQPLIWVPFRLHSYYFDLGCSCHRQLICGLFSWLIN